LNNPKLGDIVAAATKAVGIQPCEECKRRQAILNAIDFSKPITEVYADLVKSLYNK